MIKCTKIVTLNECLYMCTPVRPPLSQHTGHFNHSRRLSYIPSHPAALSTPKGNCYADFFHYIDQFDHSGTLYKWNHTVCAHLCLASLAQHYVCSSMLLHVSVVPSFSLLYSISLDQYSTTDILIPV